MLYLCSYCGEEHEVKQAIQPMEDIDCPQWEQNCENWFSVFELQSDHTTED